MNSITFASSTCEIKKNNKHKANWFVSASQSHKDSLESHKPNTNIRKKKLRKEHSLVRSVLEPHSWF